MPSLDNEGNFHLTMGNADNSRSRDGSVPHDIFVAVLVNDQTGSDHQHPNDVSVFFDLGNGPSLIKESSARSHRLEICKSGALVRISGVEKGSHLVDHDVTLKLGLHDSGNAIVCVETVAGVVPDDSAIPSDVLLGKMMHRHLGIRYLDNGS